MRSQEPDGSHNVGGGSASQPRYAFDKAMQGFRIIDDQGYPLRLTRFDCAMWDHDGDSFTDAMGQAMQDYAFVAQRGHVLAAYACAYLMVRVGIIASKEQQGKALDSLQILQRNGVTVDRMLRAAVDGGVVEARFLLGWLSMKGGSGVAANPVLALDELVRAAGQGMAEAQYELGQNTALWDSLDVQQRDAVLGDAGITRSDLDDMIRRSAVAGYAPAQIQLGRICYEAQQYAAARSWLNKANVPASHPLYWMRCLYLGVMYRDALGGARNDVAFTLLRKAQRTHPHDPHIVGEIGMCYLRGVGTIRNSQMAFTYFQRAVTEGAEEFREKLEEFRPRQMAAQPEPEASSDVQQAESPSVAGQSTTDQSAERSAGSGTQPVAASDEPNVDEKQHEDTVPVESASNTATASITSDATVSDPVPVESSEEHVVTAKNKAPAVKLPSIDPSKFEYFTMPNDLDQALAQYKVLAKSGDVNGMTWLGHCYAYGIGVDRDVTTAKHWLTPAAEQGHPHAVADLTLLLLDENSPAADTQMIAYLRHARQNSVILQDLGYMYQNGRGVEQNAALALDYYQRAAQMGDVVSMTAAGQMLAAGEGAPQDYQTAYRLFSSAAQENSLVGWCEQGKALEYGHGVEADIFQAVECYRNAAGNYGKPRNQMQYAADPNVPDEQQPIDEPWLPEAVTRLASCYERGAGVDQDIDYARDLYTVAAGAGDMEAKQWLQDQTQDADAKLNEMVGLPEVKAQFALFKKNLQYENLLRERNLPVDDNRRMHMLFLGNPGTGKTTVARLVAQMLYEMGVCSTNHMEELDRSSIITNQYYSVGAQAIRQAFDRARGGVLFIDEAYSLHQKSNQDDLGQETIDTIVKLMEDMRSEVVVIMAGYEKEMKDFLSSNSGLESRFTYKFHFADYTVDELVQMFDNRADKLGWEVDDDAKVLIRQDFEQARRGDHFGNGRYVEMFMQRMRERHVATTFDPDAPETLNHFVAADVPLANMALGGGAPGAGQKTGFTFR